MGRLSTNLSLYNNSYCKPPTVPTAKSDSDVMFCLDKTKYDITVTLGWQENKNL